MKRFSILVIALAFVSVSANAKVKKTVKTEEPKAYTFTDIKINPTTPVPNQHRSGTCWSFSTLATVESDILKSGKASNDLNLSEMWIARNAYFEKAIKYVRMHGNMNMSQGGAAHDVPNMIAKYGIVPEEVYPGFNSGTTVHVHGEIGTALKAYLDAIVKNPDKTLSTAWIDGVNGILDAYLGVKPEKFTYKGVEYTPKSYAESLGINPNDYISITSYTHYPFGTAFAVEVPDNWAWGESYNVPMNEMTAIADEVLANGYTIAWGADVSDKGFAYKKGFAVLPETKKESMDNSEIGKWVKLSDKELQDSIYAFKTAVKEVKVTQDMRQKYFDNYTVTDDHGMQIFGTAKDQNDNKFYKVKNSWGTDQIYDGNFYCSQPFFECQTINIMVNKNALSDTTKKKLGIK